MTEEAGCTRLCITFARQIGRPLIWKLSWWTGPVRESGSHSVAVREEGEVKWAESVVPLGEVGTE